MQNKSYWTESVKAPDFESYSGDKKCDVAVIGGGLTGITTATLLALNGIKTVVLEANKIGSGTTCKSTAKITIQHGLKYHNLISAIGKENALLYAKANMIGQNTMFDFIEKYKINCELTRCPSYVYTEKKNPVRQIEKEKKALDKLKINSKIVDNCNLPFDIQAAIVMPDQAYFHPLKYLYALANIFLDNNGEIYEQSQVTTVDKESPSAVHTKEGTLHADKIVLATNYPVLDMPGYYFMRVYQQRTYLTSVDAGDLDIEGMYINVKNPVNTMRTHKTKDGNKLITGGYGHKTGHYKDNISSYEKIKKMIKTKYPNLNKTPDYGWSTQDSTTLDHIPYIGKLSSQTPNIYIATGYQKWGITSSAMAAMLIAHDIAGKDHPVLEARGLFAPSRFTPGASVKEFFSQSAVAMKEYTINNLIIPKGELDEIENGEGKIIRVDGKPAAVYRNQSGKLFAYNPHCTHRYCLLVYNKDEKSFDCPCHGSRFDMKGNVIRGPAITPLKRLEISE